MVQTARAAMDMITREMRMAGYGAPTSDLSTWVDWVTSINANPTIEEGGSDPDKIHIVGCFDSVKASLSASALKGSTSLTLQSSTEAGKFNLNEKKLISIDGLENVIITDISTNTLSINQGLRRDYGVGTPLYLVKVITYSIVEENNTVILKRNENTGGGSQPLAENIEDLQIAQSGDSFIISITARTSKVDPDYSANNGLRTYTLTSFITPRNLGL